MNATTSSRRPTAGDEAEGIATAICAPAFYGPPVAFLLGPWLFVVFLLCPFFAPVFALLLVLALAAGVLTAAALLLASPYLLARHLRAHRTGEPRRAALRNPFRKLRVSTGRLGSPQPKGVS